MQSVISACDRSRLFVRPVTAGDDEEVRVYGAGADTLVLMSKGLQGAPISGLALFGESPDIIHIAASDVALLDEVLM